MTTLRDNPFDISPAEPARSPSRDDPANIDLGATQSIDISALIANQNLPSLMSGPQPGAAAGSVSATALDQEEKAS